MSSLTKHWTNSKIMVRALLLVIVGMVEVAIRFITTMNIKLEWLEKISIYLTEANIDKAMSWIDAVIAFILPILGISIWIARKQSQGAKIVMKREKR
jgi:hypothetical protein